MSENKGIESNFSSWSALSSYNEFKMLWMAILPSSELTYAPSETIFMMAGSLLSGTKLWLGNGRSVPDERPVPGKGADKFKLALIGASQLL